MSKSLGKAWFIWGCAALFYAYQFTLRISPSVMMNELMVAFAADACTLGVLAAYYYNSYALLQLPAGALVDRFGPRRIVIAAVSMCFLGAVLFASAHSIPLAAFARLLMGAGSAFAFLSCLKIGTLWFPADKLSLVVGLTVCVGTLGAVGGSSPVAMAVEFTDWRTATWMLAALALGLLALVLFIVKDKKDSSIREALQSFVLAFTNISKNPQTWVVGLYGMFTYMPLSVFADLWGAPFIQSAYEISRTQAASAPSIFYVGVAVGGTIWSLVAGKMQSYRTPLIISSILATSFFSLILFVQMPLWLLWTTVFLLGVGGAGQFLCFSIVCEINPDRFSAMAGGYHNMVCMTSGVIFQPFVGWLLDFLAQPAACHMASHYVGALSVVPLALLGSFFLAFFVRECYPKNA